jgi:predicted RNA polymerase sigma factor
VRGDICEEAIRLARLLARLMPDEPEVLGLLALLLVTDARRAARVHDDGTLASLEEQDRSRWDAAGIAEGAGVLERALRLGRSGPYVVQAAIAALHSRAPTWKAADWPQIAGLYAELARLDRSPVVTITAPSRSRSPPARGPGPRSSTSCRPIRAWTASSRCTRCGRSCCAAPATRTPPTRPTR